MLSVGESRVAVLELWGLGDAVMMSGFLHQLEASKGVVSVSLVCSGGVRALLEPTFPSIEYYVFDAPWKAFRGKYRVWRWPWKELVKLVQWMRDWKADVIVSVRSDPRDHLLMILSGANMRVSFGTRFTAWLLTDRPSRTVPLQHKVEDWTAIAGSLGNVGEYEKRQAIPPRLTAARYVCSKSVRTSVDSAEEPILLVHLGARIAVRRWPVDSYKELLIRLRSVFRFRLLIVPDPDGYGKELESISDGFFPKITLSDLVFLSAESSAMIANDSAPAHIASAVGTPVLTFFGPTSAELFRPFGSHNQVVQRNVCPWRPCFDYCKYSEAYCMSVLTVDEVWPEVLVFIEENMKGSSRAKS